MEILKIISLIPFLGLIGIVSLYYHLKWKKNRGYVLWHKVYMYYANMEHKYNPTICEAIHKMLVREYLTQAQHDFLLKDLKKERPTPTRNSRYFEVFPTDLEASKGCWWARKYEGTVTRNRFLLHVMVRKYH